MNAKRSILALCVLALFSFLGFPAKSTAVEIEYKFEGVVTHVHELIPDGIFSVGDTVSGAFVFDSSLGTVDFLPENPSVGSYAAIHGIRYVSIGSHSYWAIGDLDNVRIWNDFTNYWGESTDALGVAIAPLDGETIWRDEYPFLELTPFILEFILYDSTLNVFSSDALPGAIPDFGSFDTQMGILGFREWDDLWCSICSVEFTLTRLSPITIEELLVELVEIVTELNIRNGIATSLDTKLSTALGAIDDLNSNNDSAAIGSLNAFIAAVEAQRGKELSDEEANLLIAKANEIIMRISG